MTTAATDPAHPTSAEDAWRRLLVTTREASVALHKRLDSVGTTHKWVNNEFILQTGRAFRAGPSTPQLEQALTFMLTATVAEPIRSLKAWGVIADLKLSELCDGILAGEAELRFLLAFMSMRAIVEQVALLEYTTTKIEAQLPDIPRIDPTGASETMHLVADEIRRGYVSTRFPWNEVGARPFTELGKTDLAIPEDVADVRATNVLTLVEKLERIVPGTRTAYALLCEFTHPAYGGSLGYFSRSSGVDRRGTPWMTRTTTLRPLLANLAEGPLGAVFGETFLVVEKVLVRGVEHAQHRAGLFQRLAPLAQAGAHDLMGRLSPPWSNDELCACESGLTVRECFRKVSSGGAHDERNRRKAERKRRR